MGELELETVILHGDPYQRGRQQGSLLRESITELLDWYETRFYAVTPKSDVLPILDSMLRFLRESYPEVVEELEGVAAGASLSLDAIARINFGGAISCVLRSQLATAGSCSVVAFTDAPEGAIVGKNTDLDSSPETFYVLKIVVPDRGIPYLGYGHVGGPWVEAVINAEGLAIAQASSQIQPHQDPYAMPILHSLHLAAQCASRTKEAVDFLGGIVYAGQGANWMVADAAGNVVAIERAHDRQIVRTPEYDCIYFANHFLTPEMEATTQGGREHSLGRIARYREIFANEPPEHSLEGLRRTIADHGGAVSPCLHGHSGMYTRYACILIPRRREMRLFRGPACIAPAESYFV